MSGGGATLVYVYAIVDSPIDVPIHGMEDSPVRWVIYEGLAAAVSDVPAADFEEDPLNANIRDMGWLGPRALAHQAVNGRLFELSDAIVPLAFGTVFRDDARVRQLLSEQAAKLQARLDKVRDSAEWVISLHLLREPDREDVAAASPLIRDMRQQIATSPPGRAHLLRQRLQTLERDESRRVQADAALKVLDALRAMAVDVFREPLPSETVDASGRPLLRASVLVRRQAEAEFMDRLGSLRRQWSEPTYRLLLTGPWPPYRFGGLSDGDD